MPAHTPVPLQTRLKRWLISGLAFITSVACTVLGIDLGPPTPMCYEAPAYTPSHKSFVMTRPYPHPHRSELLTRPRFPICLKRPKSNATSSHPKFCSRPRQSRRAAMRYASGCWRKAASRRMWRGSCEDGIQTHPG